MSKLLNKKVKVYWSDAVIYKSSSIKNPAPVERVTRGTLVKESKKYIIIAAPQTINQKDKKRDSRETTKKATFLFIPRGMITKIEVLQK